MKKVYHALRRTVFIFPLVLFCFLSLALASKNASNSKHPSSAQASDSLVTIRLTMSDGRVILASQRDGEMITTGPQEGENLGIIPHPDATGAVTLDFFRISKILKKGAVVSGSNIWLASIELNSTFPQAAPLDLISSIELIGVSKPLETSAVKIANEPGPGSCSPRRPGTSPRRCSGPERPGCWPRTT